MAKYRCAECGLAVVVIEGKPPVRACEHSGAAIQAFGEVRLVGAGGVKG